MSRQVMDVPSLEVFKARIDMALGSLTTAGRMELDDLYGSFQPKTLHGSIKQVVFQMDGSRHEVVILGGYSSCYHFRNNTNDLDA